MCKMWDEPQHSIAHESLGVHFIHPNLPCVIVPKHLYQNTVKNADGGYYMKFPCVLGFVFYRGRNARLRFDGLECFDGLAGLDAHFHEFARARHELPLE